MTFKLRKKKKKTPNPRSHILTRKKSEMAQAARQNLRMQKELKLLLTDPPPGVSLSNIDDANPSSSSSLFSLSNIDAEIMDALKITHQGGCHCGHVRWEVLALTSVVAWRCNCSDCSMRANVHFIVPSTCFNLLGDSQNFLTTYTFGTHTAKHNFCNLCGITSFYIPRSNPDGIAVTLACVDPGTLTHVEIKHFDGKNWETSYQHSSIASCSIHTS